MRLRAGCVVAALAVASCSGGDDTAPSATSALVVEGTVAETTASTPTTTSVVSTTASTTTVAPLDPPPEAESGDATFDAAALLEVWAGENPEVPVLATFDWMGGLVAVVDRAPDGDGFALERYADPVVITPVFFNAGGAGSVCEAYGWHRSERDGQGYFFVVIEQPGLSFRIEPEVDLLFEITQDVGRSVGFADITGVGVPEIVEVVDDTGVEVPCVQ